MSLFHAITDFTPTGGELKKESLAKDYLRCLLQTTNATLAREFDDLWSEYKQGESQVARRVRDACACAYAVQDGNLDGTIRTGEELSQLRKSVLSLDLGNFMDLLLDEIKAPDQTESATLMNAITVGQAYWNTPSESFELVSKAMETVPSTSPLTFLRLTQRLAKIDRAGWVRRGISSTKVEKVSGHSWRMAILGWVLVSQQGEINRIECINMNCAHDMGEALVADVTPHDGISRGDKQTHERHGQELLVYTLKVPNPFAATLLRRLLTTFEEGNELEAKVGHDIDSAECRAQAVEYARRYKNTKISGKTKTIGKTIEEDFLTPEPKMNLSEVQKFAELLSQELATSLSRREDICIVFVLGGPAVGKGTQCKQLARKHGFHHISVGELLDEPSPFADFIIESKREYVIIPAQLTVSLLQDEMSRGLSDGKRVFVIDGFPRSIDQASYFDEIISDHYSTILFDCSESVMTERSIARAEVAKKAGKERVDDNPITIAKRVKDFRKKNEPVETYLKQHGPFQEIPSDGSQDEVRSSFEPAVLEKINGKF